MNQTQALGASYGSVIRTRWQADVVIIRSVDLDTGTYDGDSGAAGACWGRGNQQQTGHP